MYWLGTRGGLIVLLLFTTKALAVINGDNLAVSGFVGLGMTASDLNVSIPSQSFEFSETVEDDFIEAGIKASLRLPNNVEFNAQALYLDVEDVSGKEFSLDYASLDWRFATSSSEHMFSLGRLKSNGGIYSDTRDMPFSRPTISLSTSVYNGAFRDLYRNTDGLRWTANYYLPHGDITLTLGYGESELDDDYSTNYVPTEAMGNWQAKDTQIIGLMYQTPQWLVGFSYNQVKPKFTGNYNVTLVDGQSILAQGQTASKFESLIYSLQFQWYQIELTAEYVRQNISSHNVETNLLDSSQRIDGFYLQAKYLLSDDIFMVLRDEFLDFENDTQITFNLLNLGFYQDTNRAVAAAINWRVSANWQLAAEIIRTYQGGYKDTSFSNMQLAWRF